MSAPIHTLRDKVIAWFAMEEAATSARVIDSKNGYILRNPQENITISLVSGIKGYAHLAGEEGYYQSAENPFLRLPAGDFAMSMWVKFPIPPPLNNQSIIIGQTGSGPNAYDNIKLTLTYGAANLVTGTISLRNDDNVSFQYTDSAQWFFITFNFRELWGGNTWYNGMMDVRTSTEMAAGTTVNFLVEAGDPFTKSGFLTLFNQGSGDPVIGHGPYVAIDEVVLYNAPLEPYEQEWLYNQGNGRTYTDIPPEFETEDEECDKKIECCLPDLYAYKTPTSVTNRAKDKLGLPPPPTIPDIVECPDVTIWTNPTNGSCAEFPLLVGIYDNSEDEDLEIYYTLDGSDPETSVTASTKLWEGVPIQIANATVELRVRAYKEGCPIYPVKLFKWNSCTTLDFTWTCTTGTDEVGEWHEWAANGRDDHIWRLTINFPASTTVTRIEIYELDSAFNWTTGQAWATDTPVNPFPTDPSYDFSIFPLLVKEGGTPLNSDYMTTFGTFSGTKTWDMWGDIRVPTTADHYFQLRMFTVELGLIEAIHPADACSPGIVVGVPIELSLTANCADCAVSVDWEFTIPGGYGGGDWKLMRRRKCQGEGVYQTIATGTGEPAGTVSDTDEDVPTHCLVEYYLEYAFPTGGLSQDEKSVQTFGCPIFVFNVDSSNLVPGGTFDVSVWSQYVQDGGACGSQIPVMIYNDDFPEPTGRLLFTATKNIPFEDPAGVYAINVSELAVGRNSICIEPCNSCGLANSACIVFEYYPTASCAGAYPDIATLLHVTPDSAAGLFDDITCTSSGNPGYAPWNGNISGYGYACEYTSAQRFQSTTVSGSLWNDYSVRLYFYPNISVPADGYTGPAFVLDFFNSNCLESHIWVGYKRYGSDAAGTYKRATVVSGIQTWTPQSTVPSTFEVEITGYPTP